VKCSLFPFAAAALLSVAAACGPAGDHSSARAKVRVAAASDLNVALGELTQPAWYAGFRGHAGQEEPGNLRATAILQTKDAASATIVEDYPASRYTDYVSLLRIGGRWWIVNKVYTAETRAAK